MRGGSSGAPGPGDGRVCGRGLSGGDWGLVDARGVRARTSLSHYLRIGRPLRAGGGHLDLSGGQVEDAVAQGVELVGGEEPDNDP